MYTYSIEKSYVLNGHLCIRMIWSYGGLNPNVRKYWYLWELEDLENLKENISQYSKQYQLCLLIARDELIDRGIIDG